jgi:hypothetical protein
VKSCLPFTLEYAEKDITKAAAVRQAAEQSRGGSARELYSFASSHVKTSKSLTSEEVSYIRFS